MATLVQKFLTLADLYKRTDGKGQVADVLEVMNDTSQDIMTDFLMMPCNEGTKHTHAIRTGLPSVSWGALYEGIKQSKSQTQQVSDTTGFVEALATVDKRLIKLAGSNGNAVRASESAPFIESMARDLVNAMFYYNPATNSRHPKGLAARFGALGNTGAANQIVDAGGVGSDNTSIWFVTWGEQDFFALYPDGTDAGISQEDKGEQRVLDDAGNPYYVLEEMFSAHIGFGLKDWRNCSRIANIDVSDLQAGTVDIYGHLRKAYYKLQRRKQERIDGLGTPGRTVMYCNRDVLEALDALGTNAGNTDNFVRLKPMELEGKEVMSYRGIPIRETDAILGTEARIV